ncbi:MAG: sporulation protein YqfD [Clostridia bacterium]|nr:sporulation protein YqfD [Clostridia bacterium]
MFTRFYRFLCGYVCFSATQGFAERFLNLCSRNGIFLWNLHRDSNGIRAATSIRHYKKIRTAASRSGMLTKIESRQGLPFIISKHKKRIGLFYGAVLAAAFLSMMSTMIWSINISGNNVVTDEQILKALEETGVSHGTFRKDINAATVRFDVMSEIPELSYLTVNVLGSCLEVEVAEQTAEPHVADKSLPCDVASTIDGQIAALEVYNGTALHKQGEAIRAGEILAAGFIELTDGSVKLCHAEAYALIRTDIAFECTALRNTETLCKTKEKSYITLHIMGLDIPLHKKNDTPPDIIRTKTMCINGVPLPFSVTREIRRTYSPQEIERNDKTLILSAAEEYLATKTELLGNAHICSGEIALEQTSDSVAVRGNYLAEISAGKVKEILTE